jgi:hypothetical protein
MGGQACVLYGAAEFSRDTDLAILAEAGNLARLRSALADLQAEVIAVPPLRLSYLRRGHAVHFRCQHPEAFRMRIDVMSHLRGVDPFPTLWTRRTTLTLPDGLACHFLSLPDLVQAKKTQRDKDWPMLRRLLEAHYFQNRENPTSAQVKFWLLELRTPELLIEVARSHGRVCRRLVSTRPLLTHALSGNLDDLGRGLRFEQQAEQTTDRLYWQPLREELERLRRQVWPTDPERVPASGPTALRSSRSSRSA